MQESGDEVVDVDEPVEEPEEKPEPSESPLEYSDDDPNLVPVFEQYVSGVKHLKKLSAHIKRVFDSDWESNAKYRTRRAEVWELFTGVLPPKTFPYKDSANAHVPIAFKAITRLVFHAFDEIFGDMSNLAGVLPVGPDDEEDARQQSKHLNWQLREQCLDFKRQMQRALLMFYLDGDVVCHSSRDTFRGFNRHETLTCDEFVVPYNYVSTMPDYSDCPHYTRVRMMRAYELETMEGWVGVEEVLEGKPSWDDDPVGDLGPRIAKAQGVESPDEEGDAPYKILQWEGWWKLPLQKKHRWIQAFVDAKTGNILQLAIHEEADWQEQEQYDARIAERDRYLTDVDGYNAAQQQFDMQAMMGPPPGLPLGPMSGMPVEPPMPQDMPMMGAPPGMPPGPPGMPPMGMPPMAPPQPPVAPSMPMWMDGMDPMAEPPPPKMSPIYMFSHGVCIEPILGNLGLGMGGMQADINKAANVALSQFTDAATQNNARGIITSSIIKFKNGYTRRPGSVNVAEGATGAELRNNIIPDEIGPASPQLMELVANCVQWGEDAAAAPDVLAGDAGKSGETFRGISTRLEQAGKQLSVSAGNFTFPFLTQILRNQCRLNAIFMNEEEFVRINDDRMGLSVPVTVGRQMYRRNYRVQIAADLKFTSQATRVADADQLVQMVMKTQPQNIGMLQYALKRSLEARELWDAVAHLGPLLPPPPFPLALRAPPPQPGQPGGETPGQKPPQANGPGGPAPEGPPMN